MPMTICPACKYGEYALTPVQPFLVCTNCEFEGPIEDFFAVTTADVVKTFRNCKLKPCDSCSYCWEALAEIDSILAPEGMTYLD